MSNAMHPHIDNLLQRVQRRVPKLIDQMALMEIREMLAELEADETPQCEGCEHNLSEQADKALHRIAKLTNDPEILAVIGEVLGK